MTLRVLYLPHGRRRQYFERILEEGVDRLQWQVGTVGLARDRSSYPFVQNDRDFMELPDFAMDARQGIGYDDATHDLIAKAELASGIPTARLVLAGERDIGRGFAKPFFHFPMRSEATAVLKDNTLPERIVAAMFVAMKQVLTKFQPDIVVTGNVAAPHHLALAMLAKLDEIPLAIGRPSKIHADRSFWTADLSMLNERVAQPVRNLRGGSSDELAAKYIQEFREKPKTIAYIARTWRAGASLSWLKRHKYFVELAYLQAKHLLLGRAGARPKPFWPTLIEYYQTEWLALRQRGFFQRPRSDQLAAMRYVYLAFHKEPELAINYQAPGWHNQYETAAKLAASLPYGVRLIVREHRFNRGRRHTRFYQDLNALPNTILADPFDDQFKYITNASLIITDNGSTGWEGLLFGRPVLTLDRTFYDAAGLAHTVSERPLSEVVVQLLSAPAGLSAEWDVKLASLIAAEFYTTTPDGDEGLRENLETIDLMASHGRQPVHGAAE